MSRIHLIKLLDRWLGKALVFLLPRPLAPDQQHSPPRSVLLIRPGGIGDAVLLVPTLHALRQHFPDISIDILAERRNAGVFPLCPAVRQVFLYDDPRQLLSALRHRYDVVIDTEQWHRLSAVIARLVRSPVKIGYATNERARLFTHALPYRHDDYEVESFLRLLAPLGVSKTSSPVEPWLSVPDSSRTFVNSLLRANGADPFVVLFPGASIPERCWGRDNFRSVAQWLNSRGVRTVVVGGGGDVADGEFIVSELDAINLAGRTSLAETAAILESAAVVVSGDSGVLHIAVGLGRPTVALFGPGIAAKWAPRGRHMVLNKELSCSPCTRFGYTPPCPRNFCCMNAITAEEVVGALTGLLDDANKTIGGM